MFANVFFVPDSQLRVEAAVKRKGQVLMSIRTMGLDLLQVCFLYHQVQMQVTPLNLVHWKVRFLALQYPVVPRQ